MSVQSTTTISMSKEMSVEESYSKSTSISSSTMESSSIKSSAAMESITSGGDSGISSLISKIDSDLALGGDTGTSMKLSSLEQSASIEQSENSLKMSKSEVSKSLEVQESSSMTMTSEVSSSKMESKSISKSESISSEVTEEKGSLWVAVMDYEPRPGDSEGLAVKEGQEVEVIDSSRAHKWRVKMSGTGKEGTVPSCYLEKRAAEPPPTSPQLDAKTQSNITRREKVLKELVESEEAFARDMQYVVNNYIQEMDTKKMSKELRDHKNAIFSNFRAISDFHNNVLMKGIQYYADDPARLGKTFLRLERDFDMHVTYCRDEPEAQQLLQSGPLKEYFDTFSQKIQDEKSLSEHLKLPIQRINDYQLLLKELIKYTTRLREPTVDLEKALDFVQAIPQRIQDLQYINSIQGYKGNLHKLGRILKHDWFEVTDGSGLRRERFVFLFKGRIFITDHKRVGQHRSIYLVKYVIKLPEVEIVDNADDDERKIRFQSLKPGGATGFPITLKSKTLELKEEWLGAIQQSAGPQVEDLGDEEPLEEEPARIEELYEKHETKVEVLEDFEAYEEMHTVVTESVRSGSLTSLEDFQSALEDETSLCITASDMESGGPGRPRFVVPLKSHTCGEGVEAVLECEVCATPEATVAWLKDNSPLTSSQRATLEADGGRHRLLIKKAECADSGLYTIIASNLHGTTSCSAPLTVSSAPPSLPPTTPDGSLMPYGPIFREKLRDTELQVGTDYRACVIVAGEPKPDVKFYKDDSEIACGPGRVRFHRESDGECYELIIEGVTDADAGRYSCVATSTAGRNVTSCQVGVTSSKVFVKLEEDLDKTSTPELLEEQNFQWNKDTKEVESTERIKVAIDDSEDTVALVFQHVTPGDTGMHTCVASTSTGKITCSAELTVQGGLPREPEPPKLTATATTVQAREGESALLELQATGFPRPVITWTKDGEELKLGDKYVVLQEDDESYTMAIKNVAAGDAGKYGAEAINDLGKDEVTYDLKIASAPKFTKSLSDTTAKLGEDIELSVEIEGSPEPTVTWSKDGQPLKESDHVKIVSDGKKRRLVVKGAQTQDAGNYSCILKNDSGSQGAFAAVKVNAPAKFVKGLSDTTCNAEEDVTLSVTITGDPKPTLKWSKGGKELKADGQRIIQKDDGETIYTLIIKKTTKEDTAEYSCEVSNAHGKDTSKGKLTVKEKSQKPSFTKGLSDVEASEGEDIKLAVKLTGTPKPTVEWSKDGKKLTVDGKHVEVKEEEDGSTVLTVRKCSSQDEGSYECTITNSEGSEKTNSKVTVKETQKAPSFLKELKDISVKEGETAEFSVKFTGKPKVKWTKDGAELKIDNKRFEYKKEEAEDSLTLVLKSATQEDKGKYACVIENEKGSATTASNLTVAADTVAPSFEKGLKDVSAKEEETVTFTVKFSGKPKPEAKWTKDGAELKIDGKRFEYKKEEAEDSLTLVLKKAESGDSGTYACVISNSAGSQTTSGKLQVTANVVAPSFQKGLKDQTVKEGEDLTLTVTFTGKPKPSLKWTKDDAELKLDDSKYSVVEDGDSCTVVLKKVTKSDAGTYACTLKNEAGEKKTSSKVEVKETETVASITKELKSVTVTEEETVTLTVEYKGKPEPTTKWQKDGSDIKVDGDQYQIKKEAGSETLTIRDVTTQDAGKYSCTVTNSAGSATTSGEVTVKGSTSPPRFVKGLKDLTIREEQTVKYEVKFAGKPRPTAKWTKDGAELTIDGKRVRSVEEAGDSLTLVISEVKKDDSGAYSCTITNEIGSESTTSKLTVTESSSSPAFTLKLKDQEVREGSDAEFKVKITGKPKPTAKWTLDGNELTIDNKHTELKVEEDGASLTLVIHSVTKDDAGKYACAINSSAGTDSSSAKLTVAVPPVFTKGLEDVEAEEGAPLRLNVKFEGQPDPAVFWKRDGTVLQMDGKKLRTTLEHDESVSLIVEGLTAGDAGQYTCEVTNSQGSASSSAKVAVTGKPIIKKGLSDKEVLEGEENVELTAEATGTPPPEVTWSLNGKDIVDGDKFKLSKEDGKGVYKLTIKKAGADTAGDLKFEASNSGGKADCAAKIVLLKKPSFLKNLSDATLVEGDVLKLETSVSGTPEPEVKWFYGKQELKSDGRRKITSAGGQHTLTIEECAVEDGGSYSVKAKNKVGEATQGATVTVKSRKDTQAPVFVTHLYDQVIVIGDCARMEVRVTGKPQPDVTWFRGDEEIAAGDRVIIAKDLESMTYTLTLKDLALSDSAKYSCKAVNQYGEAREEASLTVKEPVAPHIEELEDLEVRYGAPARLKAKITGFPIPEVKWTKDDSPLKSADGYEVHADIENKRYTVDVKSVKAGEGGRYACIATNSAGQATAQCNLSIKAQMPAFVKDIPDQSAEMGEEFAFEAEIYGYPTPEVTWLKDGKSLTGDSRYSVTCSNDIYKLRGTVKDVSDAGVITCKAANKAGEDSRKANLKVADFAPMILEKLPPSVDLTEGDELTLKAKFKGKPTPEIKWCKDGKMLRPSSKLSMSVTPEGAAELVVHDVTHDDAGGYKLVATNEKGQSATESSVSVAFKAKEHAPFVGQLHAIEAIVGNSAILEAKVTGNPKPKIQWFKDDTPLESGDHVRLSEADSKAILTIEAAKIEDAGEYKLEASSSLGQDSSSAAIKVSAPGKKPSIVKELKAVKLQEGEEGRLELVVSGHPRPTVAWMHNGKNVLEGQHCSAIPVDDTGLAALVFHSTKCEDGGLYSALVSNKLGKAMSEAPVIVSPVVKGEAEKRPTRVFEFLQALMPQLVPEGKPCTLEAKITPDSKTISIKWTKDCKEIPPSERFEISQDSTGLLRLRIDHVTSADRGKYAVIVSDGQIEIKSEAMLTPVPTMPGITGNKPYFVKGLEPLKVAEGGTIKLKAELPPDSGCKIKWMKDGDDILPNDRTTLMEQPNGLLQLVVEAAQPEDSGKYVVVATNDQGKTRSSAMVAVVGAGFKLPEIVDSLQPASSVQGEAAKLVAKVSGEPMPDVRWLKDGSPVEPSDRIRIRQDPDGTVSIEIAEVKPEDAGKYTVLASNLGGEMRSSAPLQVIQSPLFVQPLESAVGVAGSPAQLDCRVSGDPVPDIKWTKDGVEVPDDDMNVRKRHLPTGEVALIFDKCRPQDAGEYKCTATNKHGEKSCSAPLQVIAKDVEGQQKSSPSFVTPLSDLKVEEGTTFRLQASVGGNPLPEVKWLLDGQPVSCSDTISLSFDGKKAVLTVYRCNPRHEGVYECKISNNQGEASSKGRVTVLAYEEPKFIERLSDAQFPAGKPMRLQCRVRGIPSPIVDWYFERQRVEPGLKYEMVREGERCALVLPAPRAKDSGIYECRARNEAGRDSCSANIAVSGADAEGEPAMFLKKLRDTSVLNGTTAKLTACVCGTPKPEVKWFKDGIQLSPGGKLTMEEERNGVIRLIVSVAKRSDAGTYRVSIANQFGSDTCTAILDIEGEDKIKTDIPKREIPKPTVHGPPSPLPHAPYIFKMSDTGASLGWKPSVPQHRPQVPVTYRLEFSKMPDGQWNTYKAGIRDSSCDIKDLEPGVDYMFRIRVENRYGSSEPSPYVTAMRSQLQRPLTPADFAPKDYELERLKFDKYAAAPRFLRQEEEYAWAVKAHPARVEFWVYGCPQPQISWLFNNQPVEQSKYDFLEDRGGQVILFITRMTDEDVGTYTCKAVNEHGEAERKIRLQIAEPPIFTKRLEPQTAMVREGGKFQCRVIGVPRPKVKWFKDWHALGDSSLIHMKWEDPDSCTLSLSDAILKDGGLYSCAATNVAGASTTSAMLSVEESEDDFRLHTYQRPHVVKTSSRPFEDFYDIGDEIGRGTQGITYHVVERKNGRSLAAKVMHGAGDLADFMRAELDVMSQLSHPRLVRLWDAHDTKNSLTLALDLCGGGELLPHILHQERLTETVVAHYVKQILEGLQHMHEKGIAHLGLTIGDVLVTRLNCDNIKIGDFGLATHLYPGREHVQEYGHPEFVAPEAANKQPVTLAADMWSVGIIAYILLVGESPFLRENDRETLRELQKGKADFYNEGFAVLSDDARDFVQQLLQLDPTKRMDVNAALKHKWLELDSIPDKCDELENMDRLREYYRRWKAWYSNASCRWFFRRRTLESCFSHPSRMIYPPDEAYTPPATPEGDPDRSRVKPAAFDDVTYRQRIEREAIDPRSESHYQSGPDTFLLPLRDPDFPVRVRRYLKEGASRSPILARHLKDRHWGYGTQRDVAVKERRKFADVMDEEIDDEKRGISRSANLRLRSEVGTPGSGYEHLEVRQQKKRRGFRGTAGCAPFFREKIRTCVIRENEEAVFQCRVTADPEAQVTWFRNDGILIESSRIIMTKWSDGRCSLTLRPAKAYDVGVYKCVARNCHGVTTCRARLNIGSVSVRPDSPRADGCSDTETFLRWAPPRFDVFNPVFGYALEIKEACTESWTKLASNIAHEFYLVRNLQPATTYHFRICAVNKFGWSEFSAPSEPIITLADAAPKIELSRAEKFQQEQTDNGQELLLDAPEQVKLDYEREEEPVALEQGEPTELYNYISELARGRFSVIMKVWHKKTNTTVVAKAMASDANALSEFEMHRSLRHERIAAMQSASQSPNSLFLVMEKLSGIDVLEYLSLRPTYSEDLVSTIVHQVIDGLEYLHFRGICYLELQPDNVVMVDRHHPEVKLIDLGAAQYLPEGGAKVHVPRGYLEYLAPEILKGEDVHTPADIWGVGVLTYILLSGVSPFAGESDLETKDNVLYVRYHFDHLYREASPEATHFLMQLFKRTPQKRPTTEECLENKWLLPNEFMIKKREHAQFPSHPLRDFSERFHSLKGRATPTALLDIFGKRTEDPR